MSDVSYKMKFAIGDVIIEDDQFKLIMNIRHDPPEYYMKKGEGGKIKWVDAMKVDSNAQKYTG